MKDNYPAGEDCPRVPACKPYFPEADRLFIQQELGAMLASGALTMGPWVDRIEEAASKVLDGWTVVATNSGTSALELLLRYYDVTDREVVVPTNTFVASANTVTLAGGYPVLVDIEPDALALSIQALDDAITPRTTGVIVVHMAGLIPPHIDAIRELCKRRGLFLIEDAAHAFGARSPRGAAGALADGAAFSLFPTKPVTAGEGGLLVTRDKECAAFARSFRCHGIDVTCKEHSFVRLGHNFRMSEINALVGAVGIARIEEAQRLRQSAARRYMTLLADTQCTMPPLPDQWVHAWYKFPLTLPEGVDGGVFRARCRERGVQCQTTYWPPVHRHPYYAARDDCRPERFPVAENVLSRTVALPIFAEITDEQIDRVCGVVREVLEKMK